MAVNGCLIYVPFENVAATEYGNMGAPDKATVATMPGHLAGPFEVARIVTDQYEINPMIGKPYKQVTRNGEAQWTSIEGDPAVSGHTP